VAISSDLSHYLDYETARQVDRRTCEAIESLDPKGIGRRDACGRTALRGLLRVAERRELDVETLELCNSGDTAGDRDEVVGYGAWVFEG
jgi:AmmeMemoRadiSam system protein B